MKMLALLLVISTITFSAAQSPYTIEDATIGGLLAAKVIKNTVTGEYVEIITDFGGRVEDLQLESKSTGKLRKVLLTHNDNATAVLENKWWKGMLLLPWANRIAYGKYTFFNMTYQLPLNENTTDPPRHNALHGLMYGRRMEVTGTKFTISYGQLQLSYHFDKPLPGYPFVFDVSIDYTLSDDGFSMTFCITNVMDSTPLPFYMGWHPYFVCTPYKAYVVLDKCTRWNHVELNGNMDPTGVTHLFNGLNGTEPIGGNETYPTFYDDEYKPRDPDNPLCQTIETHIYDTLTDQTITLWQDSNYRLVHIFTGSVSLFQENAIAIEPMSGMADAYNNHDHLSVISGGEMWTGTIGVNVQ